MNVELKTVHAHEDPEWDGAWVTCPHCNEDNGVSWSGEKECTQCRKPFLVADGPLVRNRDAGSKLQVFIGPGGQLFYYDGEISFP